MSLFKTFWKIISKNKFSVLLYLGISFGIAIIFLASGQNTAVMSDSSIENVTVGIVSEGSSDLGDGLKAYIKKTFSTTGVSDISASGDDIKEALYSGATSYIVRIDGDDISDYQAPNNTSAYVAQNYINNYINTYRAMQQLYPENSANDIAKLTEKNLKDGVRIENFGSTDTSNKDMNNFYNIFVYGAMGSLIMGIGIVMMAFNERKLYLRTVVSPISIRRRNGILFLAQACFGAIIWLVAALISVYFAGDSVFSPNHVMFLVNSIPFVLSITAIGFLIGQAVKNETVFSGVSTVLMLCVSFLSGAFIPQELLADSVLKISMLTPAYWFIVNNNKIGEMTGYDWGALIGPILVMLAFTVVLVLAGTAYTMLKSKKKFA